MLLILLTLSTSVIWKSKIESAKNSICPNDVGKSFILKCNSFDSTNPAAENVGCSSVE